jgi:pimeloyl-ACP methyl ester carboxylesterase
MTQSIYFLPGLMCDQRLWQNLWPQLSPDLSPKHIAFERHHNMPGMLADISKNLDLEPANLVGFSMGGYIALQYALQHPNTINKLVLIGASGSNLTVAEQKKRNKILHHIKNNRYGGMGRQRLKQFIHPTQLNTPVADTILDMDRDLGKDTLIAQLEATADRPALFDQLKALDFPVLIIGGEHDLLIPPTQIQHLGQCFNHAQVEIIKDSGHMSPLEAPQQVGELINQFFND